MLIFCSLFLWLKSSETIIPWMRISCSLSPMSFWAKQTNWFPFLCLFLLTLAVKLAVMTTSSPLLIIKLLLLFNGLPMKEEKQSGHAWSQPGHTSLPDSVSPQPGISAGFALNLDGIVLHRHFVSQSGLICAQNDAC